MAAARRGPMDTLAMLCSTWDRCGQIGRHPQNADREQRPLPTMQHGHDVGPRLSAKRDEERNQEDGNSQGYGDGSNCLVQALDKLAARVIDEVVLAEVFQVEKFAVQRRQVRAQAGRGDGDVRASTIKTLAQRARQRHGHPGGGVDDEVAGRSEGDRDLGRHHLIRVPIQSPVAVKRDVPEKHRCSIKHHRQIYDQRAPHLPQDIALPLQSGLQLRAAGVPSHVGGCAARIQTPAGQQVVRRAARRLERRQRPRGVPEAVGGHRGPATRTGRRGASGVHRS
mmetsp:Transcript_10125/g.35427  ORF Transcript_10125/g.35427 Transcript_10125/m.35427 type:complete len:281 (-) Transcript_10125:2-844(-)